MLCIVSLDGYLVQVNPAWQKGLGYSAKEVSGQPIFNFIHPDDLHEVATITDLESAKASIDFEFRCRCKDGSYRRLVWTVTADAEHAYLYVTARDVNLRGSGA
jgi:PAS domain S-box-containing protein